MYSFVRLTVKALFAKGVANATEQLTPPPLHHPTPRQKAAMNTVLSIPDLDARTKSAIRNYLELSTTRLCICPLSVVSPSEPLVTLETISFRVIGSNTINTTSLDDLDVIPTPIFSDFARETVARLDEILEDSGVSGPPKIPRIASFRSLSHFMDDNQATILESHSGLTWRNSVVTKIDYPRDEITVMSIPIPIDNFCFDQLTADRLSALPVVDIIGFPETLSSPTHFETERRFAPAPLPHIVDSPDTATKLHPLLINANGFPDLPSSPQCDKMRIQNMKFPPSTSSSNGAFPNPSQPAPGQSGMTLGEIPGMISAPSTPPGVSVLVDGGCRSPAPPSYSSDVIHHAPNCSRRLQTPAAPRYPPGLPHPPPRPDIVVFPAPFAIVSESKGLHSPPITHLGETSDETSFDDDKSTTVLTTPLIEGSEDDHKASASEYEGGERVLDTQQWINESRDDPQRNLCSSDGQLTLNLFSRLGSGSFGKVMSAWCQELDRFVAVKIIHKPIHDLSPTGLDFLKTELDVLKLMTQSFEQHPEDGSAFISRILKSWHDNKNAYFVMDLYPHDLRRLLMEKRILLPDIRLYAAELVLALQTLQRMRVMHRDIKPENILLSPTGHLCIADFGLSKDFSRPKYSNRPLATLKAYDISGTPGYYAPELLNNFDPRMNRLQPGYGFEVDIWSLGVVILDMFIGERGQLFFDGDVPSYQETEDERISRVLSNVTDMSLDLDKWVDDPCPRDLLSQMLDRNPKTRIALDAMKAHPFFACLDWDKVGRRQYAPSYIPAVRLSLNAAPSYTFTTCYYRPGYSITELPEPEAQMYMLRRQQAAKRDIGEYGGTDPDLTWSGEHIADPWHIQHTPWAEPVPLG